MNRGTFTRRDVLTLTLAGTAGLPVARTFWPGAAHAAGAPAYDPAARFDLAVSEVELRRNGAGRMLMAQIYQPKGPGPFPTVLDLHGGAWNKKDRFAEEPMDRALAESGLLVVAVDLTQLACMSCWSVCSEAICPLARQVSRDNRTSSDAGVRLTFDPIRTSTHAPQRTLLRRWPTSAIFPATRSL